MKFPKDIKSFAREEDGSLLVFFCISVITILGIFALSFDMGRRASTQTDMQSFADNVALAAAGELDGSANAIVNARAAATSVIIATNENLKAGTGGGNGAITFNVASDLLFYTDLPDQDRPGTFNPADLGDDTNANYKYRLPTADTTTVPEVARYVGVTLATTDVDWLFAGAVSNNAPDAAVGALAIAGNAGYTCEIAPLMFCLPPDINGNPKTLDPGQAVRLQTSGHNAAWNPGEFGYLNIDDNLNAAGGPCANLNPESRRQACILARGINACFLGRGVDIQPGQRVGQETAAFNLPFGVFEATMNGFENDPLYSMGPHGISGLDIRTNNCNIQGNSTSMPFPEDDCHYANNCPDGRFGDGNWTSGRTDYVDTNYTYTKPNGTDVPGSFFDFPESGLTRYEYYLREIERAANGGVMTAAGTAPYTGPVYANDPTRGPVNNYDSWDDYWDDGPSGFNPIIPDAQNHDDNGLPQCNRVDASANADRRVVIVAGIHCPPGALTGNEPDVPVVQYYRTFLMSPASGAPGGSNGPTFEIFVEIIEPIGGEGGGSTATDSAFREVVQLYR